MIAIKLERYYTKQEIIALYLNYFDFLHNAVGIKTAANTYFNKEPKDLTVCEAAMLIGLCKNPSLFNPVRYPERASASQCGVVADGEGGGISTAVSMNSIVTSHLRSTSIVPTIRMALPLIFVSSSANI